MKVPCLPLCIEVYNEDIIIIYLKT